MNFHILNNLNSDDLVIDLKSLMSNTKGLHRQSEKVNINLFSESDLDILKTLKSDKSIIICRPDKGRGVVIMDKNDYIAKMNAILNNPINFQVQPNIDPFKNNLLLEDKLYRFLKRMYNQDKITENEYKTMYSSGSNQGIMYGLPKIHKTNIPLRPVLSSFKCHTYKVAKFIIPHIKKIC